MSATSLKCQRCGTPLRQRPNEGPRRFHRRKYCSVACRSAATARPLAERLWEKVERGGANECWVWTGGTTKNGYGVIWRGNCKRSDPGGNILVHRAALLLETGAEPPPNLDVDHLCRNRRCCNPAHLEVVTRGQNMRRAPATIANLSERHWQQQVVDVATLYGWRHFHALDMRGSDPGWPDLVLCRPPELLIVELKSEKGKLRPEQQDWLDALGACGVETAVWRPASFDEVHARLRGRGG